MKKLLLLLSLSTFLFLQFPQQVSATHYAGCELTYTCLGGNDYLITVIFYRDCSGMMMIDPYNITVDFTSDACGAFSTTFDEAGSPIAIATTCPTQPTCCSSYPYQPIPGCYYGLQKWVFQKQVTLPPCHNWVISWSSSARNTSGTLGSIQEGWYIYANLNNLDAPCNSSPLFMNDPATVTGSNQTSCYSLGAYDPDGDSLAYSLVAPLQSAGTSVTYISPWTFSNPMPSTPPLSVDPVTGDICIHPTQQFICAMAVKVDEWRHINGVPKKIGTVVRDIQINSISNSTFNNPIPTLAGINPAATQYSANDSIYTMDVCLGDTIDFNVYAYDASLPAQNLTMNWNGGIPSANWSVTGNGTTNPVGHFHWVPAAGSVSHVSQCFSVSIQDNACPYVGQQSHAYCITVKGIDVKMSPLSDTTLCLGESYQLVALGDTNVVNYIWRIDGNIVIPNINDSTLLINSTTLGAGTHAISCTVDDGTTSNCPGNTQVIVKVVPQPNVSVYLGADQTACMGQSVVLDAGPGQLYFWQPGLQITRFDTVTSSGIYIVTVDGGFYTRCQDSDTVQVNFISMPSINFGHDTCVASPLILDAGNPGFQYQWNTGATTQTILADHSGVYSVIVSQQFGYNCDDGDTIYISLNSTNASVSVTSPYITANVTGATYQWLDCNNSFASIIGQISQSYTATVNGSYAVIVTQGLCASDTSVCVQITDVGVHSTDNITLAIYPNPATDVLYMEGFTNPSYVSIYEISGKLLITKQLNTDHVDIGSLAKGLYFIKLSTAEGSVVRKFVKE